MMKIKYCFLFLTILGFFTTLSGQEPYRVSKDQLDLEAKLIDAHTHVLLEDFEEAQKAYKILARENPDNAAIHFEMARVSRTLEDFESAERYYKKAISLDPTNKWFYTSYAQTLESQDRWADAVAVYQDLHEQFPQQADYLMQISYAYLMNGDSDNAIQTLEEYIDRYGQERTASHRLFDLYLRHESSSEAEKLALNYLSKRAFDLEMRYKLGVLYQMREDKAKAVETFGQVLQLDPDHGPAAIALAEVQGGQSGNAELNALLSVLANPAVELDSKLPKLIPYVEKYVLEGDKSLESDLNKAVQSVVEAHPNDPKAHALVADVLAQMGQKNKAIQSYEKTIQLDPSNYLVWEQLVHLCRETYHFPKMKKYAQECLDLFPVKADMFFLLGQSQYYLEEYEEALDILEEFKFMTMRDPISQYRQHILKSQIYLEQEELAKGKVEIASAKKLSDGTEIVTVLEALLMLEESDGSAAQKSLKKISDPETEEYWLAAIRIYQGNGSLSSKISEIIGAADQWSSPRIWEALGDSYLEEDPNQSVEYWKKAQSLFPYDKSSLDQKIANRS